MKLSKRGQFYGVTHETICWEGITLTDTEYSQDKVPWHFHENNYFTFILEGGMKEGNKKEVYECAAGDLLFHNWQDAHYNVASGKFTRGFHVELGTKWFESLGIKNDLTQGSIRISSPRVKTLMYNIFKEAKLAGDTGQLGIDALLIEMFGVLGGIKETSTEKKPKWVSILRDMLNEPMTGWNLADLARAVGVHPVHLSRDFSKYFGTTLGDHIRTIRVQRALALLPNPDRSLTDIAFQCDFADQSHFIRSFKSYYHITPLLYRKLLLRK